MPKGKNGNGRERRGKGGKESPLRKDGQMGGTRSLQGLYRVKSYKGSIWCLYRKSRKEDRREEAQLKADFDEARSLHLHQRPEATL